ncbi:hypothetical protein HWV62_2434 [Athelia sp. TMB]|nr:hypothetical protein HWV62_2434 [Athelia sp. TMB]
MESSSSKAQAEEKRQAEIRKQIALLQAQLGEASDISTEAPAASKRKRPDTQGTCLAPATPSPKKRKRDHLTRDSREAGVSAPQTARNSSTKYESKAGPSSSRLATYEPPPKPAPSNVLAKLAGLKGKSKAESPMDRVSRTSGFLERPAPRVDKGAVPPMDVVDALKRDDQLALIEDLEPGPYDHKPPIDDPFFKTLEPNSGIRLSSRSVPHDDIQEYLTARYYLSPSRLYSVIRLQPNKQGYDVPVEGDWVTIAVVAERGPIKYSRAPVTIGPEDEGAQEGDGSNELVGDGRGRFQFADPKSNGKGKGKDKAKDAPYKKSGKKYLTIKLVDFGSRARSASSATGGKAVIRGDAFLSLLLFEADACDVIHTDDGKKRRVYRGGSRGAFEDLAKLGEGDVVALLNPKILKPFQRAADSPHPSSNILAVTPESSESIVVLGRAKDLGTCQVVKHDGKTAVERRRAGRAEFAIGTSGMGASNKPARKPAYDPARQWGLKPEPVAGTSTYVISGHVVGGTTGSIYVAETMGREGQAKAKRKLDRDADRELKALLERDKEGMRAVVRAREVAKEMEEKSGKQPKGRTKGKDKAVNRDKGKEPKKSKAKEDTDSSSGSDLEIEPPVATNAQKNAYSASIIKQLGFDPTVKTGHKRIDDIDIDNKMKALSGSLASRKDIALGPRPGQRIRSGVVAPRERTKLPDNEEDEDVADFEAEMASFRRPVLLEDEKMVDLDYSSE